MSQKVKVVSYIVLGVVVITSIVIIYLIDTGRIASYADEGPLVESASELTTLPNPDSSTWAKLFGIIASPFTK